MPWVTGLSKHGSMQISMSKLWIVNGNAASQGTVDTKANTHPFSCDYQDKTTNGDLMISTHMQ